MHKIELQVDDSIYEYIMFLLKNLKVKGLDIKEDIDFSKYKIDSFKEIDPLKYQQKIRNEWK